MVIARKLKIKTNEDDEDSWTEIECYEEQEDTDNVEEGEAGNEEDPTETDAFLSTNQSFGQ